MTDDKVVIEELLFTHKPDFVTHYQFVLSGGLYSFLPALPLRLHTFTKLPSLKYYIPRNCYFLLPGSTPGWNPPCGVLYHRQLGSLAAFLLLPSLLSTGAFLLLHLHLTYQAAPRPTMMIWILQELNT